MHNYNPKEIEQKWQHAWEDAGIHKAVNGEAAHKKYYSLETFPYPSAAGLHVGHPAGYTAEDINVRFQRMNGKNVLYCIGWDAFGLPTENYAIKIGKNPQAVAVENIANFKRQVKMFGFSYDWDREITTSDPLYYKWTQWIFLQLYTHGLAYRKKASVNWCESCKTVLAREQVVLGACERCKTIVVQKEMEQWFFKITQYAEELLSGLDALDWPESTKQSQRNWIGKSEGAVIAFALKSAEPRDQDLKISVFTTRPDTLFGVTYMVLSPEHSCIDELKNSIKNWEEVEKYRASSKEKNELERTHLEKEKTGVALHGICAINPANNEKIPVWIADYVLMSYGTGAVMAVPAHDERDFAFAKKYNLPIRRVIDGGKEDECWTEEGKLINSGMFDAVDSEIAKWKITATVGGEKTVHYRLRDWLVSRQRYWGAPIPMIWCDSCGVVPVPEDQLPVLLPDDVDFKPTGAPPLAGSAAFQNVTCPKCGGNARRDYETMDTFVDSSWYFFRYCSSKETHAPFNKKDVAYWMPVDLYVIGAEHVVLHLLYARFFTKALRDMGLIAINEPFQKMRHVGLILGADGQKMSKSRGNVVNPDELVATYGADVVRMFEMFIGPLEDTKPWSTKSIVGIQRFLQKVWRLSEKIGIETVPAFSKSLLHRTIKSVTEDITCMHYNTAIAAMMSLINEWQNAEKISRTEYELFLKILHPFAPHCTEELWHTLGHSSFLITESWPRYDAQLVEEKSFELVIQINGKVRGRMQMPRTIEDDALKIKAQEDAKIKEFLKGKKIRQIIVVPQKLVNFVVT